MQDNPASEVYQQTGVADRRDSDLADLVRLHTGCLPGSLFSRLGAAVTRSLYAYVLKSDMELVVVIRDTGGTIVGGSVVSLNPDTLIRRLLLGSGILFNLLFRFYRFPLNFKRDLPDAYQPGCPELMFLYVDEKHRSLGYGKVLVEGTQQALAERGISRLCVYTEDDPQNRAISFYQGLGYTPAGKATKAGTAYLVFEKQLA